MTQNHYFHSYVLHRVIYYLYEILQYLRVYFFLINRNCFNLRIKSVLSSEDASKNRKKVKMKFVQFCLRLTQVKGNHDG